MACENLLELENVRRGYRTGAGVLEVLKGVDFTLRRGEWCCVYGASGSGKTTLLNLLGALEKPDCGRVVIDGVDVAVLGRRAAARFRSRRIGFVFQAYHLLPELTVLENAALPARLAGVSSREAARRAAMWLERVGLAGRMDHRPTELSGGEQQRAAIARALINDPGLLLADEPTGNLDQTTGEGILALFSELRTASPERTIIMITHNRDIASRATVVAELADGLLAVNPELVKGAAK